MKWTRKRPIQPGWYWWREPEYNNNMPEMAKIVQSTDGLRVLWFTGALEDDELEQYDGQWAGPLVPPEAQP